MWRMAVVQHNVPPAFTGRLEAPPRPAIILVVRVEEDGGSVVKVIVLQLGEDAPRPDVLRSQVDDLVVLWFEHRFLL